MDKSLITFYQNGFLFQQKVLFLYHKLKITNMENSKDSRSNVEKIKSIFYDYAQGVSHNRLSITTDELEEIAKRIETEVMGIEDPNEFVNLKDINKK